MDDLLPRLLALAGRVKTSESYAKGWLFKVSQVVANQAWIDLLVDIVSIACFVWGTYLCFRSLLPATSV